eukprot:629143-Rhodomonas_salina.3
METRVPRQIRKRGCEVPVSAAGVCFLRDVKDQLPFMVAPGSGIPQVNTSLCVAAYHSSVPEMAYGGKVAADSTGDCVECYSSSIQDISTKVV